MNNEPTNPTSRRPLKTVSVIVSSWSCVITAIIAMNPTQLQFCVAFVAVTLTAALFAVTFSTELSRVMRTKCCLAAGPAVRPCCRKQAWTAARVTGCRRRGDESVPE